MLINPLTLLPLCWKSYMEIRISYSRIKSVLDEEDIQDDHVF